MNFFDVKTAPLKGVNLVEASAGTGKTYSVAILVLRCLLENKGIPIGKILMVTFTKPAVAELEERVRKFVNTAHDYAIGKKGFLSGDTISDIVKMSWDKNPEKTQKALARALSHLDELSVMTIHSFCQKNLKEFAFASGQMFEQDILADESELIAKYASEYWQNLLCSEDKDLILQHPDIKFKAFKECIQKHLAGEKLELINEQINTNAINELQYLLDNDLDELAAYKQNNATFRKKELDISSSTKLIDFFRQNYPKDYLSKTPEKYLNPILDALKLGLVLPDIIYNKGLSEIAKKLQKHKESRALLSYNDLISKMHDAVVDPEFGKAFAESVSKNYWAVFIDEFQDTDAQQNKIFDSIFAYKSSLLYYIGDPKQSIYSWRSADLDVYDKAKASVEPIRRYTMDTNFRSEKSYINAVNTLYKAVGKDDFKRHGLNYIPIKASKTSDGFACPKNENRLNFVELEGDEHQKLALKIKEILNSNDYSINGKNVIASDIGVLVYKSKDAKLIKGHLEKEGIPSILRDGDGVFKSEEAKFLSLLLQAIVTVNAKNIGAALVGIYFGIQSSEWNKRETEKDVLLFKKIQLEFTEKGVFACLNKLLIAYGFYSHVATLGAGDRMQSNVQQIMELLHSQQNRGSTDAKDLVQYLQREREGFDGLSSVEDDREKRIESDENAVQISTIHKAKGLQYNIVLALTKFDHDLINSPNRNYFSYKKKGADSKCFKAILSKSKLKLLSISALEIYNEAVELYKNQKEEENLRMIYVLLTRAVYAKYLFGNQKDDGSFKHFKEAIENVKSEEIRTPFDIRQTVMRNEVSFENKALNKGFRNTVNLSAFSGTYFQQSYSSLSAHAFHPTENGIEKIGSEYDTYVFKTLPRGAQAGTFLHELLENVNFSDDSTWDGTIQKQCKRHGAKFEKEEVKDGLNELIKNTVESNLGADLALKFTKHDSKLNEMEFCMTSKDWDLLNNVVVKKHFGNRISLAYDRVPDGFLNGFIDLIFEHKGKYHILDWKSNHLGNNLENYASDELDDAMTSSNYHLQYLIYSIALYRYLKQVLGDNFEYDSHMGNVYYLYLRGLRSSESSGVFKSKIPLDVLKQFD